MGVLFGDIYKGKTMIIGLQIGKGTSVGVPGKNVRLTLGRPIMEYPLMAASHCELIDRIFVSTDSDEIAETGKRFGATYIARPSDLAHPDTLTEDVLTHALKVIRQKIGCEPELIALMFCQIYLCSYHHISPPIMYTPVLYIIFEVCQGQCAGKPDC